MLILAIDTATTACSCCVYDSAAQRILSVRSDDIGRGHAEYLMAQVQTVLDQAGLKLSDIDKVAAVIGPGSFTGIRVGVSAARGFALALGINAVGISCFEALAFDVAPQSDGAPFCIVVDAGRNQFYLQCFDGDAAPLGAPAIVSADDFAQHISRSIAAKSIATKSIIFLAGNGAQAVAPLLNRPTTILSLNATGAIETVAALASVSTTSASPLYLRGADAKPQTGFAIARQQDGLSS